jgi:hypothetical protein
VEAPRPRDLPQGSRAASVRGAPPRPFPRSAWGRARRLGIGCLVALVAVSGCIRPLAAGAEPERESARAPPTLFGAAALWLNGTAHVSTIPAQAAAVAEPDEPHNCFSVRSVKENVTSYLGGILVEMEWTAASSASQRLNVTVRGPPKAPSVWSAEGPSPFRLSAEAGDVRPVLTPFTVEVGVPTGAVPVPEQTLAFHVGVGVLESDLGALAWEPCGLEPPALPLLPLLPTGAGPGLALALPRTTASSPVSSPGMPWARSGTTASGA